MSAVEKDRARLLVSASEYSIADIFKKSSNFIKKQKELRIIRGDDQLKEVSNVATPPLFSETLS